MTLHDEERTYRCSEHQRSPDIDKERHWSGGIRKTEKEINKNQTKRGAGELIKQ